MSYTKIASNHVPKRRKKPTHFSIKLARSNDDDSRKQSLKYICLKCHIWCEINQTNFPFGVLSLSGRFIVLLFYLMSCKCFISFSLFCRDPECQSISNFYSFVSLCMVDYIKCSHCQQLFISKYQFLSCALNIMQPPCNWVVIC